MRGRRGLRGGIPRLFGRHNTHKGYQYRRYAAAIVEQLGIEPDQAGLLYQVGQAAAMWVTFQAATERLEEARAQRGAARGRRPSLAQLDRLEHRQIAASTAHQAALQALQEQADRRPDKTYAEVMRDQAARERARAARDERRGRAGRRDEHSGSQAPDRVAAGQRGDQGGAGR